MAGLADVPHPPSTNPAAQIKWMIGYIQGRYGAAPEPAADWYGNGAAQHGVPSREDGEDD